MVILSDFDHKEIVKCGAHGLQRLAKLYAFGYPSLAGLEESVRLERMSQRVHLPETCVPGKTYFVKLSSVFEVRRASEDF